LLHAHEPQAFPVNIKANAEFVPVSRKLFYKAGPEIQALLRRIADADRAVGDSNEHTKPLLVSEDDANGVGYLSDRDIETEIKQTVAREVWALKRRIGIAERSEREDGVHGTAIVAAYLDKALREARRAHEDLGPLVTEFTNRRQATALPGVQEVSERISLEILD